MGVQKIGAVFKIDAHKNGAQTEAARTQRRTCRGGEHTEADVQKRRACTKAAPYAHRRTCRSGAKRRRACTNASARVHKSGAERRRACTKVVRVTKSNKE